MGRTLLMAGVSSEESSMNHRSRDNHPDAPRPRTRRYFSREEKDRALALIAGNDAAEGGDQHGHQFVDARRLLKRALRGRITNRENAAIQGLIGLLCAMEGDWAHAARRLRAAARLLPGKPDTLVYAANAELRRGRPRACAFFLRSAMAIGLDADLSAIASSINEQLGPRFRVPGCEQLRLGRDFSP